MRNVEMVNTLLACKRMKVNKRQPLDWAAKMGHPQVVQALHNSETHEVDANALKWMRVDIESMDISLYGGFFTSLHLPSLYGHTSVAEAFCEDPKGDLRAKTENKSGVTALQIAKETKRDEIVKILTDKIEVEKDVKRLYRERQVHVDAANAIDCKCDFRRMATTAFRVLDIRWKCKH